MVKKIGMLIGVLLILCALGTGAVAAEQPASVERFYETIPFQVNPLYESLIDPADFEETDPEDELSYSQPTFQVSKSTYVTPEKAVKQLRESMKNRQEVVNLYIKGTDSNYQKLINGVFENALEHTGKPTEGDYLAWHFAGWKGSVEKDWENPGYYYQFSLRISYYTSAEQEKELNTAVKELITSLNLKGKSNYEKVCAVYDFICANITYDYENLNNPNYGLQYSAYAALVNKTAVCQGYANLLYRLLLELGIDNRIITGETFEGAHAWNIVKLGKVYYNVDATWDAILGDHSYFLKNSESFADHFRYLEYLTIQFHTDYPMSETDYVDGVAGEPEHMLVGGMCGPDAYWTLDRDMVLTVFGTGEIDNYSSYESPWHQCGTGIKKIIVEEGITRLGSYNFHGLPELTSVTLPESLTGIGSSVFRECTALTEIVIPDNVEYSLGSFEKCTSLKRVTLGKSLRSIGMYEFSQCYALEEINFPESLAAIGGAAFQECNSLKEITIPASVGSLAGFRYCENLQTVHIHAKNISADAFYKCPKLKNVILYDTVERVADSAFEGCEALEELIVPASVVAFGVKSCRNLDTIRFEGSAPEFSWYAFSGINAKVYYPENDPSWTEEIRQQYGGMITWVPYFREELKGIPGDVNGDGKVNNKDASRLFQYLSGWDVEVDEARLDINGDGKVNNKDASRLFQYLSGWDVEIA